MIELELQCSKCKEWKGQENFYKTKQNKNGYRSWCKPCHTSGSNGSRNRSLIKNKHYHKRKAENPQLFMWKQAKHRAKWDYGGMEFTIEVDDIVIPEQCPYLQVPFIPLDKSYGYSLDRIDSSKGYTKDNIQVISRLANIMKNNATKEQLISFAKGVLAVHSKEVCCE